MSNTIYTCHICKKSSQYKSKRGFGFHIRSHGITTEEYYRKYERSTCVDCGVEVNFYDGKFSERCQSCAAKKHRSELKNDKEKYNIFVDKVKQNMKDIWSKRDDTIPNKISETITKQVSQLSSQERLEKYSRYYTCDDETIDRLNKQGAEHLQSLPPTEKGYVKTYKGRYKPNNPEKYKGDSNNIVYRSGWERSVCKWCDESPQVKQWSSEEVIIPYLCETDKKIHRYFMDFYIQYKDGRTVLVEVKPFKETSPPKTGRGKSRKTVLSEGMTYIKNQSKWSAARDYASDRGWHFEIWTENELRSLGILSKPLGKKPFKPLKKMKPYRKPKK